MLFREIKQNNEYSEKKLTAWRAEAIRRDQIKTLNNSLKVIEMEKALFETHFAESSNIVPFLDNLENLAQEVGATAEVSSVEILKDGSGLMVGMSASGYFEEVYKFLMLLENSPYELEFALMDIQDRAVGVTEEVSEWSATFKIKLLSFVK